MKGRVYFPVSTTFPVAFEGTDISHKSGLYALKVLEVIVGPS